MSGARTGRILIIEDNPINMELATDLLESVGYDVAQAEAAEEGIEKASSGDFDLILMDVSLPGLDGLQAARQLRARPGTRTTPIVALTAHAMRGDQERAIAAGCSGYITKPIDMKSFLQAVQDFVAASRRKS